HLRGADGAAGGERRTATRPALAAPHPYAYALNNAVVHNDPDGRDATVVVEGNTITIQARIYITGSDATQALAKDIQQAISKQWSTDPRTGKAWTVEGGQGAYQVKLDVRVAVLNPTDPIPKGKDVTIVQLGSGDSRI